MKTLIILLLTTFALNLNAQKRTVNVDDFTSFSFGTSGTVYVKQGNSTKLEIESSDDRFDELEIKVRNGRLTINDEGNWNWNKRSNLTVYLTMETIDGLSVSGSGKLYSDGELETEDLKLRVSGSGDMELDLNSADLDMKISGSGSLNLSGQANRAEISISGSGVLKAKSMPMDIFDATISGSGSCYVTVNEEITASISGSGSVNYDGNPSRISSHSSGSGKIRKG